MATIKEYDHVVNGIAVNVSEINHGETVYFKVKNVMNEEQANDIASKLGWSTYDNHFCNRYTILDYIPSENTLEYKLGYIN